MRRAPRSGTVILATAGAALVAPFTPLGSGREFAWIAVLLLVLAIVVFAGKSINGRYAGTLIDDRNKISLSRLQLATWTVLVLSAYFAAVLVNKERGARDPLAVQVPEELWILLGISTASLVGSPLLKGQKRGGGDGPPGGGDDNLGGPPNPHATVGPEVAARFAAQKSIHTHREGAIVVFDQPSQASWSDVFTGEEVSNWRTVDIAKVQLFIITLVAGATYAYAIFELFQRGGAVKALPEVSDGMNALLGISHAGYLTHKALPLTPKQ